MLRWHAVAISVGIASFIVYRSTMAPGLTWAHYGADGGDLAAAVASSGIPHPPGYPTYVLLGQIFAILPVGTLAFRLNLMSAVCASVTIVFVFLLVRHLIVSTAADGVQILVAALAALTFALSPTFWSQAIITEVYTLNALFVALLLYMVLRPDTKPCVVGLVLGIGLGNHLSLILLIPTLLVWLSDHWLSSRQAIHVATRVFGATLLGLAVYAYLPLRAHFDPFVNWGDPRTVERFLWVVTGGPYRDYVFGLPLQDVPGRLSAWANLVAGQFGWWGVILALLGLWDMLTMGNARRGWGLMLAFGLYTVYAIGYRTQDSFLYLIPAFMIGAIWVGRGMALVIEMTRSWGANRNASIILWPQALPVLAALALALLPITQWQSYHEIMDLSQDVAAEEYIRKVLTSVPANSVIITASDEHTFSLWYGQLAGSRQDLLIVDRDLMQFTWYRKQLQRRAGDILAIKDSAVVEEFVPALIEAMRVWHEVFLTDTDEILLQRYSWEKRGDLLYRLIP